MDLFEKEGFLQKDFRNWTLHVELHDIRKKQYVIKKKQKFPPDNLISSICKELIIQSN